MITPSFPGAAVGTKVLIWVDGVRYDGPSSTFNETGWTGYDSGPLAASDFAPAGLDLCPSTPQTLTFGYFRSNSTSGMLTNVHGIDEWSVRVTPRAAVP